MQKSKVFVSPQGNDDWSGRLATPNPDNTDGPVHSLAGAQRRARELRRGGAREEGVTVELAAGHYHLSEPFVFTSDDSGTASDPAVYRAAPGAAVHLTGGVAIDDWKPVRDPSVLNRLPPEARGAVLETDLRAHGCTDFCEMKSGPSWAHSDPGLELFCRDVPMTLARYPNEGYLYMDTLSVEDGHHIRERHGSRVARFRVEGERERLLRWSEEAAPLLHGYWFYDWADQRLAVAAIDAEAGEITLDESHPHQYGYRQGQWFYAFNLLCELDQPGEWYLDRSSGRLYFWPPHDLNPGDAVVSITRDPITLQQVRHFALEGFTIEAARGTAVQVKDGEAVTIAGCTIRNIGQDAVHVEGGKNHRVVDCDIYQTGDGGIFLEGGDRPSLSPGGHEAVNNHLHHLSRWNPLYKVGIQLKGVGNRALHNRLHDLPHVAIGFTGNEQLVERNEIYRVCTQANDAGAVYTSGAHPEDWSMRGHRVRFNYLHHLEGFEGRGCNGIYLDDMFSGTEIHGNILYRVYCGMLLGGGRDIRTENNLIVDCPIGLRLDARALGWAAFVVPMVVDGLKQMPYREEPWASRYPELVSILDDQPCHPKNNTLVGNCISGCPKPLAIEVAALELLHQANNRIDPDPNSIHRPLDFHGPPSLPNGKAVFEAIPFESIGLRQSPRRPTLPPRKDLGPEVPLPEVPSPNRT